MDRLSGVTLDGEGHLVQSIGDILATPLGTRPMRRDYGSLLFELVDAPANAATRLLCIAAIALALARWEPRIAVTRIAFTGEFASGQAVVTVEGRRTDLPAPNAAIRLTVPLR